MNALRSKKRVLFLFIVIILLASLMYVGLLLYKYNYFPHRKYTSDFFNITQYKSSIDHDNDGIDDQSDILFSVHKYLDSKPKYKSKFYSSGYSNDEYGVCTDVVANGLLGAGYDLRELVDVDVAEHPENYNIDKPDKNIDFRRVVNLKVYFDNNAISLTTDYSKIEEWQAGDIVVWKHHIGIISENRNKKGIPFVLHHSSPYQAKYEEDILENWGEIKGHYRIS